MGLVVLDLGVENILQAIFPHKFVRENSNTLFDLMVQIIITPHPFQTLNRVDFLLGSSYLHHEIRIAHPHLDKELLCFGRLLDKAKDSLTIIFGNILSIIPQARVMAYSVFGNFFSFDLVHQFNLFL